MEAENELWNDFKEILIYADTLQVKLKPAQLQFSIQSRKMYQFCNSKINQENY